MIEKDVEIVNRLGLHARAASRLVHLAGNFQSQISLIRDGESVDAKSILGLLMMAASQGTELTVRCDGVDEQDALTAVTGLIADRFEEEK